MKIPLPIEVVAPTGIEPVSKVRKLLFYPLNYGAKNFSKVAYNFKFFGGRENIDLKRLNHFYF